MVTNPSANTGDRRFGFDLWVRRVPWRGKWQPTPGFLSGKPIDRGAWQATVHGVAKSQTQLSVHAHTPTHAYTLPIFQRAAG